MTYVQSFSAVTPPPRYDAVAWTELEVWESATEDGTFLLIDTQSIAVDATPESPNTVQITTTDATLAEGWYRFRFKDATPNYSNYTESVLAPAGSDGTMYFSVAELRARFPELTIEDYPEATVSDAIALAVEAFEHAADVAFVPRTETFTLTSGNPLRLDLPRQKVTSIDSIEGSTTGTVAVDGQIVGGVFINANPWSPAETLTVTLTHGYDETPLEVRWAVMLMARNWLIRSPSDDRRTQLPTEGGGVINLATPGMFGAEFAIPDVDRVLKQYRKVSCVP